MRVTSRVSSPLVEALSGVVGWTDVVVEAPAQGVTHSPCQG